MNFDHNDQNRVAQMEGELEKALAPFATSTEAGLAAIALGRVCRRMLEKYRDRDTRRQLGQVIADYIEEREEPRFLQLTRRLFQ